MLLFVLMCSVWRHIKCLLIPRILLINERPPQNAAATTTHVTSVMKLRDREQPFECGPPDLRGPPFNGPPVRVGRR